MGRLCTAESCLVPCEGSAARPWPPASLRQPERRWGGSVSPLGSRAAFLFSYTRPPENVALALSASGAGPASRPPGAERGTVLSPEHGAWSPLGVARGQSWARCRRSVASASALPLLLAPAPSRLGSAAGGRIAPFMPLDALAFLRKQRIVLYSLAAPGAVTASARRLRSAPARGQRRAPAQEGPVGGRRWPGRGQPCPCPAGAPDSLLGGRRQPPAPGSAHQHSEERSGVMPLGCGDGAG